MKKQLLILTKNKKLLGEIELEDSLYGTDYWKWGNKVVLKDATFVEYKRTSNKIYFELKTH